MRCIWRHKATNVNLFVQFGEVIPMSKQLEYFSGVVKHMTKLSGAKKTSSFLCRSIFLISAGSNDMFEYSASPGPSDDYKFLSGLVAAYKQSITVRAARHALRLCSSALDLKKKSYRNRHAGDVATRPLMMYAPQALYEMGARKFSVISVPPLGCLPSQRLRRLKQMGTQGCFDPLNDLSLRSYPMLAAMLQDLARDLPGMAYSLADAFTMVSFVFENPRTDAWSKRSAP
ncbi:GDSL esterase/lipase At2g04570-like [Setaria viridis]|uniref:GDSL esterase/lipase At2g04570-like n=1 Tax=Setaria viridis TaxID=4556 RepID=UPI003B3BAF87